MAKWLPNGMVQYLGRIDSQIKIHGERIELSEIEVKLSDFVGVKQAVVVAVNNENDDVFLIAYVLNSDISQKIDKAALRNTLKEYLPTTMVPQFIIELDAFPLTPNYKVDKKRLSEKAFYHHLINSHERYGLNIEERQLLEIWSEVLTLPEEKISIHDNFFELGGYSLLATKVSIRIEYALNKKLSIKTLFDMPTIAEQAREIRSMEISEVDSICIKHNLAATTFPLSSSQKRIWYLTQLFVKSPFYNLSAGFKLSGNIDVNRLKNSIEQIMLQQTMLRTVFGHHGENIFQSVIAFDEINMPFSHIDYTDYDMEAAFNCAVQLINDDANNNIALNQAPLFKVILIKLTETTHILYFNFHHIIFDGWSWEIFKKHISQGYNKPDEMFSTQLNHSITYQDYVLFEEQQYKTPTMHYHKSLNYWLNQLKDAAKITFPTDKPRNLNGQLKGEQVYFDIPKPIYDKTKVIAKQNNVSIFAVLLTAFNLALKKSGGNSDQLIAIPTANRLQANIESTIGCFINTLIIRTNLADYSEVYDLLQGNKNTISEALDNQVLPYEHLIAKMNPERALTQNPLSQIMFSFQNTGSIQLNLNDLTVEEIEIETNYSRFDIEWQVWTKEETLFLRVFYNTTLFLSETITNLFRHFIELIEQLHDAKQQKINQLIAAQCLDTPLPTLFTKELPRVDNLFAQQVKQQPNAVAIKANGQTISYQALQLSMIRFVHYFQHCDIQQGDIIAILLPHSQGLIATLLALFKIGAITILLTDELPYKRAQYIINDSQCKTLITDSVYEDYATHLDINVIYVNECIDTQNNKVISVIDEQHQHEQSAYIAYTSGTSGYPKGVKISHQSLTNVLIEISKQINFEAHDSLLAITTLSFDIALLELLLPLIVGGSVVFYDKKYGSITHNIHEAMNQYQPSVLQGTPSFLSMIFCDNFHYAYPLKVLSGGERLTPQLATNLIDRNYRLWNVYGPTETTIWSLMREVKCKEDAYSIGWPINHTQAYVFDEQMNAFTSGGVGELYIGVVGLASNYLNNEKLTLQAFSYHHINESSTKHYLYKTGDKVKQLQDGSFVFIGRTDDQVNINGYRVELAEIESVLLNHEVVKQAAVIYDGTSINAYVKLNSNGHAINQLRQQHIAKWRDIYDSTYSSPDEISHSDRLLRGWNNSYTRSAFTEQVMKDWLDNVVADIEKLHPKKILEIGAGLGALASRMSPLMDLYYAVDMSIEAMKQLTYLKQSKAKKYTSLSVQQSDGFDITAADNVKFDTVIINSVIQYFPDADYLMALIESIKPSLTNGAHIYIGDVRNLDQLAAYRESLAIDKQWLNQDHELLCSPQLFIQLTRYLPYITNVILKPKMGRDNNELTLYRYDVILEINGHSQSVEEKEIKEINWQDKQPSLETIKEVVTCQQAELIYIKNIDNARIYDDAAIHPEDMLMLAKQINYFVDLRLSLQSDRIAFDAIFSKKPIGNIKLNFNATSNATVLSDYANFPLALTAKENLLHEIKATLPHYMYPSHITIVNHFPMNQHGKIDKLELTKNKISTLTHQRYVKKPMTLEEQAIADIWKSVLNLSKVGVDDSFFELGGHSFLAISMLSEVELRLKIKLPLVEFYKKPTISNLINTVHKVAQSTDQSNLTLLSENESSSPMLLFYPIDGQLNWYRDFINLSQNDFCIYGFNPILQAGKALSIEACVDNYYKQIKTSNLSQSAVLIGWSYGALLAYELACRFEQDGNDQYQLILIDPPILNTKHLKDKLIKTEQFIHEHHEQLKMLQDKIKYNHQIKQDNNKVNDLSLIRQHLQNMLDYKPNQRVKKFMLVAAGQYPALKNLRLHEENIEFWQQFTNEIQTKVIMGADHYDIMKPPYIDRVFTEVKQMLVS